MTQRYLDKNPQILDSLSSSKTKEELHKALIIHGAGVVESLGAEVDRIEMKIKVIAKLNLFVDKKARSKAL